MPRTQHCGSCIYCRFVRSSGIWEVTAVNSCSMLRCFTQMENRGLQACLLNLGPHEPIPTEWKTNIVVWKDEFKRRCYTSPVIIPHWFFLQVALLDSFGDFLDVLSSLAVQPLFQEELTPWSVIPVRVWRGLPLPFVPVFWEQELSNCGESCSQHDMRE